MSGLKQKVQFLLEGKVFLRQWRWHSTVSYEAAIRKSFHLKRHYSTKHEKTYGKYYENSGEAILKQLKGNQTRNQEGQPGNFPPLRDFELKMCSQPGGDNRTITPA